MSGSGGRYPIPPALVTFLTTSPSGMAYRALLGDSCHERSMAEALKVIQARATW
ncbi:hypothetical protein [Streptomyces malaysiensis]|uniref:hypothetical protein n=1 Tax=Streptomyces malaysiensis TaxID=92644 RepID=UPI002B2CE217|nr:hypothetical protein R8789_00035 [Streptomyces malaysiensis]WPB96033.1 hypothetical protein R8789_46770 [Streptomyces malaysiensis]